MRIFVRKPRYKLLTLIIRFVVKTLIVASSLAEAKMLKTG